MDGCLLCHGTGDWNGWQFHCPSCFPLSHEIDEIKNTLAIVHTIPNLQKPGWGVDLTEDQETAYTHLTNNAIEWLTWLVEDYDRMTDERTMKDAKPR